MATPGSGKPEHSSITGKEGNTEVYEQKLGSYTEQYGRGTQRSQGPLLLPRRRQDICLLPMEMLQSIKKSPLSEKMKKDCQAEGTRFQKQ